VTLWIKNCLADRRLGRSYTPNYGREDDSPSWLLTANSKKVVQKKVRPALGGEPAAREPGLGTGRGGDVTGLA